MAGIGGHRRLGLDSNVLIYLLEGSTPLADRAAEVLDTIAAGAAAGVMSVLALAEVCAGPARIGDPVMVERYADELTSLENVTVVPVSVELAVDAASLRASSSMTLADAIHLASARGAGATAFLTNDRRLRDISGLAVLYLDEL